MSTLAKLRDFCGASTDFKIGLDNIAAHLFERRIPGTLALMVTGGIEPKLWVTDLAKGRFEDFQGRNNVFDAPDFLVYSQEKTLLDILSGRLSPLTALLRGRLRYAGNEKFGLLIFRELAATQDAVFEPCREPEKA